MRINLHSPLETRTSFLCEVWSRCGCSRSSMVTAAMAFMLVEAVLWGSRLCHQWLEQLELVTHNYTNGFLCCTHSSSKML